MSVQTTRRALIGGSGIAAAAVIAGIGAEPHWIKWPAAPADVYTRYVAAVARFNGLPDNLESDDEPAFRAEEQQFLDAHDAVAGSIPATLAEFAIYFDAVSDGSGWSKRALRIVRDLAAKEAR